MAEKFNHPEHYGGDTTYEAIKVIEAWKLGFHLGNAVKYICRAGKKPDTSLLDDLKKAKWYLDRKIAELEVESTTYPGQGWSRIEREKNERLLREGRIKNENPSV